MADMVAHMVADMEVDMVADKVADMVADMSIGGRKEKQSRSMHENENEVHWAEAV